MFLLDRLIRFMTLGQNENCVENTVIKLASSSVLEILKDLIPNLNLAPHSLRCMTELSVAHPDQTVTYNFLVRPIYGSISPPTSLYQRIFLDKS
jgi:hypothetical protein